MLTQSVSASIYANLETKEVTGIKDGEPIVRISDGKTVVVTTNPKAKHPRGTRELENGGEITVPMNDAGYEYYSNLFEELNPKKKQEDYSKLSSSFSCEMNYRLKSGYGVDVVEATKCTEYVEAKKCKNFGMRSNELTIKDYPVDRYRMVSIWLKHLNKRRSRTDTRIQTQYCDDTELVIGCTAGSCWAYASPGEHGFYPGEQNLVSIDGARFSWIGDPPNHIRHQMWKQIKDGSRFAYELVHWPYKSRVTGVQTISLPKGLKDKIYRLSLIKP